MVGAEIIAGIGAAKTALDIVRGLKDISDKAKQDAAIYEVLGKLIEIQQAYLAIQQELDEMHRENLELKNWAHEKERYELAELTPGNLAYTLKKTDNETEAPHYLCPNCYQDGEKRLLIGPTDGHGTRVIRCNRCSQKVVHSVGPPHPSSPRRRSGGPNSWMGR